MIETELDSFIKKYNLLLEEIARTVNPFYSNLNQKDKSSIDLQFKKILEEQTPEFLRKFQELPSLTGLITPYNGDDFSNLYIKEIDYDKFKVKFSYLNKAQDPVDQLVFIAMQGAPPFEGSEFYNPHHLLFKKPVLIPEIIYQKIKKTKNGSYQTLESPYGILSCESNTGQGSFLSKNRVGKIPLIRFALGNLGVFSPYASFEIASFNLNSIGSGEIDSFLNLLFHVDT